MLCYQILVAGLPLDDNIGIAPLKSARQPEEESVYVCFLNGNFWQLNECRHHAGEMYVHVELSLDPSRVLFFYVVNWHKYRDCVKQCAHPSVALNRLYIIRQIHKSV